MQISCYTILILSKGFDDTSFFINQSCIKLDVKFLWHNYIFKSISTIFVNKCTIYCQEWGFKTWVEDLWSSSLNIKFSGLIIFGRPCIMTIHLSNTAKNLNFYDHLRIELMSLDAKHRAMSHKYSIYQNLIITITKTMIIFMAIHLSKYVEIDTVTIFNNLH